MADPMTPSQLIRQLTKWKVPFREYKNWENNNRNHTGLGWGPVHGLMLHHTGSDSEDQRELLYSGRPDLEGPLSQYGIAQDGTFWLIGHGRANHAGKGDPDVLRAIIKENYGDDPPVDNEATEDGNVHFFGIEIWYSGSHPMTNAQLRTVHLASAAILDFYNWKKQSVIAHGEWQPGKWDPGYSSGKMMDMSVVRNSIDYVLKQGTGDNVSDGGRVEPKSETYKKVWETDAMSPPKGHGTESNPKWMAQSLLRFAAEQSEAANNKLDKLEEKIDKLTRLIEEG